MIKADSEPIKQNVLKSGVSEDDVASTKVEYKQDNSLGEAVAMSIAASDPETVLSNKLADYIKNDWINNIAESADKLSEQTEEEKLIITMAELVNEKEPIEFLNESSSISQYETELEALTAKIESNLFIADFKKEEAIPVPDPPLPTEHALDKMLMEIRQLEQEEAIKTNSVKAEQ